MKCFDVEPSDNTQQLQGKYEITLYLKEIFDSTLLALGPNGSMFQPSR